jgi:hypothetical protein
LASLQLKRNLTEDRSPVFIARMKTKTMAFTLAFSFLTGVACFAAADPQMGTWKLNEAKSKISPGSPKNSKVVYSGSGDVVKVATEGTDANGKPAHAEWRGRYDGKFYPVTGDPTSDGRAYKKVNDRTLDFRAKKDKKIIVTGRVVVAPDGKSRTVTTTGTHASGKKFKNKTVYDKQ